MAITNADYLAQVELASVSNVAKDSVVNTFAFRAVDPNATFTNLCNGIASLYQSLDAYMGSSLNGTANAHTVKLYHLIEPEPRPPVHTQRFSAGSALKPYPAEVALCLSFAADAPSGSRPARRRGRIFLGPMAENSGVLVDGYIRPTGVVKDGCAVALEAFGLGAAVLGWQWCVWSRADNTLFPVVRGWINDEFDTQRRRGPEVTSRRSWSFSD